jgi:hypothetical protein
VLEKVSMPGVRVTEGSGDAPVPLKGIDWGLPGASSVAAKLAWRVPGAVGENTTLTVQVAFGERTVGNEQFGVATKSEEFSPFTWMELRLRPWSPVLVSVMSWEPLDWPTVMLPKSLDAGKRDATGPLAACAGEPEIASAPWAAAPPNGEPGISEREPL